VDFGRCRNVGCCYRLVVVVEDPLRRMPVISDTRSANGREGPQRRGDDKTGDRNAGRAGTTRGPRRGASQPGAPAGEARGTARGGGLGLVDVGRPLMHVGIRRADDCLHA
jgi:hypothetical protein